MLLFGYNLLADTKKMVYFSSDNHVAIGYASPIFNRNELSPIEFIFLSVSIGAEMGSLKIARMAECAEWMDPKSRCPKTHTLASVHLQLVYFIINRTIRLIIDKKTTRKKNTKQIMFLIFNHNRSSSSRRAKSLNANNRARVICF